MPQRLVTPVTNAPARKALSTACLLLVLGALVPAAQAAFPGRPILLSAEGGGSQAAWVAYDNGDVLRCDAQTGTCQAMGGLPTFASPVSLSAEPDRAAAWIGWSDGSLYRCTDAGRCAPVSLPADTGPELRLR